MQSLFSGLRGIYVVCFSNLHGIDCVYVGGCGKVKDEERLLTADLHVTTHIKNETQLKIKKIQILTFSNHLKARNIRH